MVRLAYRRQLPFDLPVGARLEMGLASQRLAISSIVSGAGVRGWPASRS